MTAARTAGAGVFRKFIREAGPIRLREPLAEILGAFEEDGAILEYSFTDAVKMAGHSCPSVAGAFLCCQEALDRLYPGDDMPVRGEIAVTVYGGPDEAAYGAMSQVISLITGAAPATGFKGLGGSFVRKDLLTFSPAKPDPAAISFEFKRLDTDQAVLAKFYPWAIPFPEEKGRRLGELLGKVVSGAGSSEEKKEFRDLWMEKIEWMLAERRDIQNWLKVDER